MIPEREEPTETAKSPKKHKFLQVGQPDQDDALMVSQMNNSVILFNDESDVEVPLNDRTLEMIDKN